LVEKAASVLYETGLYYYEEITEFDIYNEYKRGFPRLRSSSRVPHPCTLVLLADNMYGLAPLEISLVARDKASQDLEYSTQILFHIPAGEVKSLPVPRLPWLFAGLCQRFLDLNDDLARSSAEQLVDAMDLDESWCDRNLMNASPRTRQLASRLVKEKHLRLDEFTEYKVTCFIANIGEAQRLRRIPGYE
jgi:hypothetical protein